MVITPVIPHRLSARGRDSGNESGSWGTPQIATPAIVGGALIIIFAIYIIWQRRQTPRHSYNYQPVRSDWARMFVPRRRPQRVRHRSIPITIDDSMRSSGFTFDFRRSRPVRSDSSESQAPLTTPSNIIDFSPTKLRPESQPVPRRHGVRWWWFFGSRPREVKSEEPGSRWRIDGSDGSSTGHGHSSHEHEESNTRHVGTLEAVHEDREEDADSVIRIGDNFASVESTPLTQHFPEQVRVIRGMSPVPEHPLSSGSRTPQPVANVSRSRSDTPVTTSRGLPPSYEASHSHTQYPSTEDVARSTRSQPYMVIPAPVRTAAYSPPRLFHGRELSSDSVLATQPPMVATSLY